MHIAKLLHTWLIETQIWEMICLSQEGLRSQSASFGIYGIRQNISPVLMQIQNEVRELLQKLLNKIPNCETYFTHLLT